MGTCPHVSLKISTSGSDISKHSAEETSSPHCARDTKHQNSVKQLSFKVRIRAPLMARKKAPLQLSDRECVATFNNGTRASQISPRRSRRQYNDPSDDPIDNRHPDATDCPKSSANSGISLSLSVFSRHSTVHSRARRGQEAPHFQGILDRKSRIFEVRTDVVSSKHGSRISCQKQKVPGKYPVLQSWHKCDILLVRIFVVKIPRKQLPKNHPTPKIQPPKRLAN